MSTNLRDLVHSATEMARARVVLRGTRRGVHIRTSGRVLVDGRSGIEIGSRALFIGGMLPTHLYCAEGAELVIGEGTIFNYGVTIEARQSIRIGSGCMFGSFVHVRDDDGRTRAPVRIEDDVWIAHGAIIEAGTTVGRGSVVAAGAVAFGDVPPGSLAVGNPAISCPLPTEGTLPAGLDSPYGPGSSDRAPTKLSRAEVRAAIIEWLDDTRCFGEAERLVTSDTISLRRAGVLDSLGLVQLLAMFEQRFGVKIDPARVAPPDSQTIRTFVELVVAA
jgi:acetyltransferase-like isoleucine patch superfamily enzyme/acyl carrier protein